MNDQTEAVAIKPSTEIAPYKPIEAGILEFLAKHENVVHDVATTKGMEAARRDRAECRSLRVKLEDARVLEKAESLAYGRKVDAEATRIRTIIERAEERYDSQIKAEEQRKEAARKERERIEAERIAKINQRINWLAAQPTEFIGAPSEKFVSRITMIEGLPVDVEHYAEFLPNAIEARTTAVAKLREMHAAAVANETEAARLKAEREELERQKVEQERIAAAERARLAEEERVAKAKRDEDDRVAREQRAAEQRRIAEEDRAAKAKRDEEAAAERKRLDDAARIAREEREAADAKAKAERDEQDRIAADKRAADEKVARERQAEIDRQQATRDAAAREQRERDEAAAKALRDAEEKRLATERAELERAQADLRRQQELAAAAEFKRRLAAEAEERRQRDPAIAIEEIYFILSPGSGHSDEEARETALAVCVRVRVPEEQKAAA